MDAVDESAIGDTPLVELDLGVAPTVYAKVEWLNLPHADHGGGSVKSRIATSMLDAAERRGEIEGRTVIEPSSGNTAVALARVAGARGYDVEIITSGDAGAGKVAALREAGATVRFVDADAPYAEKIFRVADRVADAPKEYYWPNQYANPANPAAHEDGTATELREQAPGLTHVVTGVGTGGTITGLARGLPDEVTAVGYDPETGHGIEGLRIDPGSHDEPTGTFDREALDRFGSVADDDAATAARGLRERYADREVRVVDPGQHTESFVRERLRVPVREGATLDGEGERGAFLVGPSTGASVAMVRRLCEAGDLGADDTVAMICCDRGDRYRESLWAGVVAEK